MERIAIIIPIFNDWESLSFLLPALDHHLGVNQLEADVVVVDDASDKPVTEDLRWQTFQYLRTVDLVKLRRNLGHQRAIAVGILSVYESPAELKAIVVMDGDGEDRPEDVPKLVRELDRHSGRCVVFAARSKRLEGWAFRAMYQVYRAVHWLLTGVAVRVGNFSAMTPAALRRLVIVSELWNHYAASVFRSRIPYASLPLPRGKRYSGQSQMRFPGLVLHGLSAVSVFSDIVGVRLLLFAIFLMFTSLALLTVVVVLHVFSSLAIPAWATSISGLSVIVLVQAVLLILVLSFITLAGRSQLNVIPLRDAGIFVDEKERLFEAR